MATFEEGDKVCWKWGSGTATGRIQSIFEHSVTRTIKGNEVVRNGSKENPALYIVQDDGDRVLKLASEVEKT